MGIATMLSRTDSSFLQSLQCSSPKSKTLDSVERTLFQSKLLPYLIFFIADLSRFTVTMITGSVSDLR